MLQLELIQIHLTEPWTFRIFGCTRLKEIYLMHGLTDDMVHCFVFHYVSSISSQFIMM